MKILPCSIGGHDGALRGSLLGSILGAVSIMFASSASSETLRVPSQFPTIQRAIDAAVDGDVVRLQAGIYQPFATIDTLGKGITVQGEVGPGSTPLVTIDGRNSISLIQCVTGEGPETLFENLIIKNGRSSQEGGGMLITNGSSPTVYNCAFIDNVSDCHGGAVAIISPTAQASSSPGFVQCIFEGNEAICHGGGVYADRGNSVFVYCDFKSNRAVFGGGMYGLAGISTVVECGFECNDASADGGGLHLGSIALANVSGCSFRFNSAFGTGAGIFFSSSSQSLENSWLCGNTPDQIQGVFFDAGGNTVSTDCPPCPDANQDGIVNGADLALLLSNWGPCTTSPCPADFNGDGIVNGGDLSGLLSSWGPCPSCR